MTRSNLAHCLLGLVLTSCATPPLPPDAPTSPASPRAREARPAPLSSALRPSATDRAIVARLRDTKSGSNPSAENPAPASGEMSGMQHGEMSHPRAPKYRVDRDFAFLLSEWRINTGTMRPNPNEMTDFNIFSLNPRILSRHRTSRCETRRSRSRSIRKPEPDGSSPDAHPRS